MTTKPTNADLITWLAGIKSDDAENVNAREFCRAPSTIIRGGAKWSVATDGRVLVAIQKDLGLRTLPDGAAALAEKFISGCEGLKHRGTAQVEDLRAWAADRKCLDCHGALKMDCPRCGCGQVECDSCHKGLRSADAIIAGTICGMAIDKRLVLIALRHCAEKTVSVGAASQFVSFRGEEFIASVVGLLETQLKPASRDTFLAMEKSGKPVKEAEIADHE